ncbi:PEGA domain-containing protein [Natronolimnobius sp. AArcel1]|uniref:PEGA domain-containing protein n=1 Tax=Natronolimnobius sp. AArcel1 TaxID=1679093 RepID=UPI0013EB2D80|nr:PEGA domain-containing protein [Natronolimnobius sp. AArcel1]NGM71452.1 PEGA domain-containing protein [Natronolimnobius sp. AArcel1]
MNNQSTFIGTWVVIFLLITGVGVVAASTDVGWNTTPPAEVEYGDTFTVAFSGEVDDTGEHTINDFVDGDRVEIDSTDIEGSFVEFWTVDTEDFDPGEELNLYGMVEEDSWLGGETDTTPAATVQIADVADELEWETAPPTEVDDGDSFTIIVSGSTSEEGEVCLDQSGYFSHDECEEVDVGSFEIDFTVDSDNDLGLEPGDDAELTVSTPTDESLTRTVGVTPATHIDWQTRPPTEVEYGETFQVAFAGEVEEEGDLALREAGILDSTLATAEEEDEFTRTAEVDTTDFDPGDEIDLYGEIEEDGWWGTEDDTTSVETVQIENIPDEVEWGETPPDNVEEDETVDVTVIGSTSETGEVCLDQSGYFSHEECEEVDIGSFEVDFTVDPETDLGLEPGDETELTATAPNDESSVQTVGIPPKTFIEWDTSTPESIEYGETFQVTLEGAVENEGELALRESSILDTTLATAEEEDEFTRTAEVDTTDFDPGDEIDLYGEIEEDGWWGTEDDTTSIETVQIGGVSDEIHWEEYPPNQVENGENFDVSLSGSTTEAGEVCIEQSGFLSHNECEEVDAGSFEVDFNIDVTEDLGVEHGEETELTATAPDAETSTTSVGVPPATYIEWDTEPPESVEHGEIFQVSLAGEVESEGELTLRESGLLDTTLASDDEQGEFTRTAEVDTDEVEPGDEIELYGEIEEDGWWGTEDDTTSVKTVQVGDVADEIRWEETPPEEVEEGETFEVAVSGSTSEDGEVCLDQAGYLSYETCEDVEVGSFDVDFSVDAEDDLGIEPGDETDLTVSAPNDETSAQTVAAPPTTFVQWESELPTEVEYGDTFQVTLSGEADSATDLELRESRIVDRTLASETEDGEFSQTAQVETTDFDPGDEITLYGEIGDDTTTSHTVEIGDRTETELDVDLPAETDGDTVRIDGQLLEKDTGDEVSNQPVDLVADGTILNDELATSKTDNDGEFTIKWDTGETDTDESVNVFVEFENSSSIYEGEQSPGDGTYPIQTDPEVEVFDHDIGAVWSSQTVMQGNTTKLYLLPMSEDGFETDPPADMPEVELAIEGLPDDAYEIDRPEDQLLTTFPLTNQRATGYATPVEIDTENLEMGEHSFEVTSKTTDSNISQSNELSMEVVDETDEGARSVAFDSFNRTTTPYWWSDTATVSVLDETGIEDPATYTMDKTSSMLKNVHSKKGLVSPLKVLADTYTNRVAPLLGAVEDMETGVLLAESANESDTDIDQFHQTLGSAETQLNEGDDAEAADTIDYALDDVQTWRNQLEEVETADEVSKEVALEQLVTIEEHLQAEKQQLEPEDASITFVDEPDSEIDVSDNEDVEATVEVTNTGVESEEFFVGYSAIGPDGNEFDNDGTTGTTVELEPNESKTTPLTWSPEEDTPSGEFDLYTSVWKETDRDDLETRLDADYSVEPVVVTTSEDRDVEFETELETEPAEEFEVGDEFQMAGIAENTGYDTGEVILEASVNGEARDSKTAEVDPGEGVDEYFTVELENDEEKEIELVAYVDDDPVDDVRVEVEPVGQDLRVEDLSIENPTTDDPFENGEDEMVIDTIAKYSDNISPEEVANQSEFGVQIGDEWAEVESTEFEEGVCDADCPSEVPVTLTTEIPDTTEGINNVSVIADLPEGESLTELQTIERTESSAITLESAIDVVSSPTGAEVTVDGENVGTTPVEIEHHPKEDETVTVDKDGYESEEVQLEETESIDVDLHEKDERGTDVEVTESDFSAHSSNGEAEILAETTIENTGEEDDEMTVEFFVDGESVDEESIFVEADESDSILLSTTVSEPREYDVQVTGGDEESIEVSLDDDKSYFSVQHTESVEHTQGEDLNFEVEIENTGNEDDTQTIEIDGGDLGSDSIETTINSNESTTENVTLESADSDAGTHTVTVESEDDSTDIPVEIQPDGDGPFFDFATEEANEPVEGEQLEVPVTTTNIGDEPDEQTISMAVDGSTADEAIVDLDKNTSANETLTYETETGDAPSVNLTIDSDGESASKTQTATVEPSGEPNISIEPEDEPIEVNETTSLIVSSEYENGTVNNVSDVARIESSDSDTATIEETEVTGNSEGNVTIEAEYGSESSATELAVESETESDGNGGPGLSPPDESDESEVFELGPADVPSDVGAETTAEIEVPVENVGETAGITDVTLSFADYEESSSTGALGEGDETTITFEVTTPDEPGEYEIVFETTGDEYTTELSIEEDIEDAEDDSEDGTDEESQEDDSTAQESEEDSEEQPDDSSEDDEVVGVSADEVPGFGASIAVVAIVIAAVITRVFGQVPNE